MELMLQKTIIRKNEKDRDEEVRCEKRYNRCISLMQTAGSLAG
jgi:hypothetical protein